jgi:hypothetical protein
MKKSIKINFLFTTVVILFCSISHAQQKASDKSFETIMNEAKQKRAMREKTLEQLKQSTPSHSAFQSTGIPAQPESTNRERTGTVSKAPTGTEASKPTQEDKKPLYQDTKHPVVPKKE